MTEDFPYTAFELPDGIDPDPWARALLEQIERDVRQGSRAPSDRPRVYFSGHSIRGDDQPLQVIAENDAYRSVINFDIRDFDADVLRRRDLPSDVVPVTTANAGSGRTCCFLRGIWRITLLNGQSALSFVNVTTGETRVVSLNAHESIDEARLDSMYATDLHALFRRSGAE